MSPTNKPVFDAALSMPHEDRVELADRLWTSLGPEHRTTIDNAWIEECDRRVESIDTGVARTIPGPEAMRLLRERRKP